MGLEDSCVHCGFCLEACPTYVVTRSEVHSPRGRITAVKLDVDSQGFDTCMFCRRCELACPSGVEYARIITKVRRATPEKILMNSLLERPRLAWRVLKAGKSLNSGLIQRVRLSLRDPQEPLEYREESPEVILFPGCLTSLAYRRTVENALKFLKAKGLRVSVLNGCCGLAHRSEGQVERAQELVRRLTNVKGGTLVSLSSNCTAHMRESGVQVLDFSEYVLGLLGQERVELSLTVHDPCHANMIGLGKATREVLRKLGVNLVEMEEPSFECGAGGGYFLFHPQIAENVMELKAEKIRRSGTNLVVSTNPSCSLVLSFKGFQVVHLADLLAQTVTKSLE